MKGLPAKKGWAYGGVVFNQDRQVLLREPANHFDGYVWTFPKGKSNAGETEEEAALREVAEETGIIARIAERIPGKFKGSTGSSIYFLMTVEEDTGAFDTKETQRIDWVDRAEAEKRIRQTTNAIGRERDLKVLEAALKALE